MNLPFDMSQFSYRAAAILAAVYAMEEDAETSHKILREAFGPPEAWEPWVVSLIEATKMELASVYGHLLDKVS